MGPPVEHEEQSPIGEPSSPILSIFIALVILAVYTCCFIAIFQQKSGTDPATCFCYETEYWTLFGSGVLALIVYFYAEHKRWYESLRRREIASAARLLGLLLTLFATIFTALRIGVLRSHVIGLVLFFVVFIVWDLVMWLGKKHKGDPDWSPVCEEASSTAKHYLFDVDLPSAVLIGGVYLLAHHLIPETAKDSTSPELVVSGVSITLLAHSGWVWIRELVI
jgi:hypothetical protein